MSDDAPVLVDADTTPLDRFKELPDGIDAEVAEDRIKRAFAKHGARRQERRARELAMHMEAERREAVRLNRASALRTVVVDGATLHFGACACRWHGLRVSDPEAALREYDAHACTIPLETEHDHPAFRELRYDADGKLVKRPASALALNQVTPDGRILNSLTEVAEIDDVTPAQSVTKHVDDDFVVRAALLELK
jgi:hypothetical protein